MQSNQTKLRWRWGALAACAVALLALYPQLSLRDKRGADYQGEFVSFSGGDEEAYAAYINALRDGRPRRTEITIE